MKRLHVHLHVADLDRSIRFYNALFGAEPTVLRDDYAKWRLEDPRVNFAISTSTAAAGLDHLGIEVDAHSELEEVARRARSAAIPVVDEPGAHCCYARSNKHWFADPEALKWELFHTFGQLETYGAERGASVADTRRCCA